MLHPLFLDAEPGSIWSYVAAIPMIAAAVFLFLPRPQSSTARLWNVVAAIYLVAAAGLLFIVPLPVVLLVSATAIYLSLPRPQPYPLLIRGITGGLAVLSVLAVLISWGPFSPETVLFFCFAGMAVLFGGLLVTQHDPARAALSFAMVVMSTCGLFLLQAAPFLMAATIIIYAGAIIVTFLFVLMLAQQHGLSSADYRSREAMLSTIAGFVLLGSLLYVLKINYNTKPLEPIIARLEEARATDPQKVQDMLLEEQFNTDLMQVLPRNRPDLVKKATEDFGKAREPMGDKAGKTAAVDEFIATLKSIRLQTGDLRPSEKLPMSPFSGAASNSSAVDARRSPDGSGPLPATNVAALGKTLFTDYLLSVELGGTLLLVATIGAIAITGRRGERTL
jgi:NADH:ubiquinone oxidoreductase subunit 6 (subunit J)